jgi:hypothetical protein
MNWIFKINGCKLPIGKQKFSNPLLYQNQKEKMGEKIQLTN